MVKLHGMLPLVLATTLIPTGRAHAMLGPEVPPPLPSDPVAAEPAAAPAPPPPLPVGGDVAIQSAVPPKPAFSGKGLLISAYAVTGFSWVSRLIALGVGLSIPDSCGGADCALTRVQVAAAFTFVAPISQLIATGLVIPGGLLKGRSDGWDYVTSGKPNRNGRAFLIAGAVLFGVFTAGSIALRPTYVLGCFGNVRVCGGRGTFAAYMLGVQATDTLSTAGAGLMTYGIAYQNYRKTHEPKVAVGPWSSRGAYGLSLSGRF